MSRKNYTPEQIIKQLRAAEILLGKGETVAQVCKKAGISEQTYYRWRREYGGMQVAQAKRLRDLEKENSRLKRLVADLNLDKAILEEALKGNY
jgi:putative transposase